MFVHLDGAINCLAHPSKSPTLSMGSYQREYICCSPGLAGGIQVGKEDEDQDAVTFALVGEVTPLAPWVSTVSW